MSYLSNAEIKGFFKHIVRYNVGKMKFPKGKNLVSNFVKQVTSRYEIKIKNDQLGTEDVEIRKNGRAVIKTLDHGQARFFNYQIQSLLKKDLDCLFKEVTIPNKNPK